MGGGKNKRGQIGTFFQYARVEKKTTILIRKNCTQVRKRREALETLIEERRRKGS